MPRGKTLPMLPLVMVRHDLEGIPDLPVPEGYRIRLFRDGDVDPWAAVQAAAGAFDGAQERAREWFASEFGPHLGEVRRRCLMLETGEGAAVGTTMAWRDPCFQGRDYGRIHWVAVTPQHQGEGLGRLLVVKALARMRGWHDRAYLTTQTSSWIAVHLYLSLGFVPILTPTAGAEGWALLRREAPHRLLGPPPYETAAGA